MNLNQLGYFVVLAQEKSINKAAKELFISQQCLSRSLNSMENELGGKLFFRSYNGIILTPLGEKFLNFSINTLQEYEKLQKNTQEEDNANSLSGTLHLGVTALIADNIMPELLNGYCNLRPGVNFNIIETTNYDVIKLVKKGKIDMGILMFYVDSNGKTAPALPTGCEHGFLCNCETIIWAGKKMFSPQKRQLHLEEVQKYPISICKNTDMKFLEEVVFNKMKLQTPDAPLANNMRTITKLVEGNKSVCVDMQIGKKRTLYQNYFEDLQVNRFEVTSLVGYNLYLCYVLKEQPVPLSMDLVKYMREWFV